MANAVNVVEKQRACTNCVILIGDIQIMGIFIDLRKGCNRQDRSMGDKRDLEWEIVKWHLQSSMLFVRMLFKTHIPAQGQLGEIWAYHTCKLIVS